MTTLAEIANSKPASRSKPGIKLPRFKLPSFAKPAQSQITTKQAALRLVALGTAVYAGVHGYESLRCYDWFNAVETSMGVAPAIPALLAASKLADGLGAWRTNRAEVVGGLLSLPVAAALLSAVGAGGEHGAMLAGELAGLFGGYDAAAWVALSIIAAAVTAPFAGHVLRIAGGFGDLLLALDWRRGKVDVLTTAADDTCTDDHDVIDDPVTQQSAPALDGLEGWLADNGLDGVRVVGVQQGNSVDTYDLQLPARMRAKQITEAAPDISRHFGGRSVRVIAVTAGKSTVSVEVARASRQYVEWSDIVASPAFTRVVQAGGLPVVVGVDKAGANVVLDMRDLYHVLIAGRTGAGKSVGLNSIIMGLAQLSDDRIKMLMIDPKQVELAPYAKLPHMVTAPITELRDATMALNKMCRHMESRYAAMTKAGVRNIGEYNDHLVANGQKPLPYIVVIADEFADMVLEEQANKPEQVEGDLTFKQTIQRLAQKARAAGIHLILTTQRPDAKIVDGVIKANIPGRICYQTSDAINSRIVLDESGAEALLDKGDCLIRTPAAQMLTRAQGANISTKQVLSEIAKIAK